jgi:hypothetical protein
MEKETQLGTTMRASLSDVMLGDYRIIDPAPATGILYITKNSPDFISGHLRLRGKDEGRYPYHYLEMINNVWGPEPNTIEVCSRNVTDASMTVDIFDLPNVSYVCDGQDLQGIPSNQFDRWRCDPPYNKDTARQMYGADLPSTSKLLIAGARVCKLGALMFLLLGPQDYQWCPPNVKRIGWIAITIVPNNELRALHIYRKERETQTRLPI